MGENREKDISNVIKEMQRVCFGYELAAIEHIEPLAQLLLDNPCEGIRQIRSSYEKGANAAYGENRSIVETLCGGPAESLTWPLYNAVGAAYPYLDREQKDGALRQLLSIMDELNYAYVNGEWGVGHTTGIREPLLIADICNAQPRYWPGLDEGKLILKYFDTFSDLQHALIDENGMFRPKSSAHAGGGPPSGVNSDFLVAYALLRNDGSAFGEYYMEVANPAFLERVIRGIVAWTFGRVRSKNYLKRYSQKEIEERIAKKRARLIEVLPKSIHDRLEPIRQEADWADPDKFSREY